MDQLPDLQSDADVDALMARVRAKLVVAAPAAAASERSGNALRDFLTVQAEYASAMSHALQVMATTLEELQGDVDTTGAPRGRRAKASPRRRVNRRQSKTR